MGGCSMILRLGDSTGDAKVGVREAGGGAELTTNSLAETCGCGSSWWGNIATAGTCCCGLGAGFVRV